MPSELRYWGTKQGKIVKANAVDSIHSWRDLQSATHFTEKELNYNLFLLFQDGVLKKNESQYYLTPSLEASYQEFFRPAQKVTSTSQETKKVIPIQAVIKKPCSFVSREILVMGVILLLVFVSAFNSFNSVNDNSQSTSGLSPDSGEESTPTNPEGSQEPNEPESSTPTEPESSLPPSESESSQPSSEPEGSSPPSEPEDSSRQSEPTRARSSEIMFTKIWVDTNK